MSDPKYAQAGHAVLTAHRALMDNQPPSTAIEGPIQERYEQAEVTFRRGIAEADREATVAGWNQLHQAQTDAVVGLLGVSVALLSTVVDLVEGTPQQIPTAEIIDRIVARCEGNEGDFG
jgi:hypothetical protein